MKNPSKQEIIDKIKELKDKSDKFEQQHEPQTVICIAIAVVGFKLSFTNQHHVKFMNEFGVTS